MPGPWASFAGKMGRPAHTDAAACPDNRCSGTADGMTGTMMQEIEELLTAEAPSLDHLESMLTDGYAQALALEAERWRLERRLGEVAREGGVGIGDELSSIGRRLNHADDELSKLRALLRSLHERARTVRAG